jgi:hypothetical protein
MYVADLLDPAVRGDRLSVERHHLYPVAYLKAQGIDQTREIDQIANFALVEWPDNADIGAAPPSEYAPTMLAGLSAEERARQALWHALPEGWTSMPYAQFLGQRRKMLANVVRRGFERIGTGELESQAQQGNAEPTAASLQELILAGESTLVEFKSTARWSINDQRVHDGVELSIVKTVAGFLNTNGGSLVIGVADDGATVGLEHDYATLKKRDRDGFELYLYDLLGLTLGKNALSWLKLKFETVDGRDVAVLSVARAPSIVFTNPKGQKVDDVYVRFGNSTRKLTPAEVMQYVAQWNTPAAKLADGSTESSETTLPEEPGEFHKDQLEQPVT